jgi:hypothetical protein
MFINLKNFESFSYAWPTGKEQYDSILYKVITDGGNFSVRVGFTNDRDIKPYAIVFVDNIPRVEFRPVNDFNDSGYMISTIKKSDKTFYMANEPLPIEYACFYTGRYGDYIADAVSRKDTAVIVVNCADILSMIRHGTIRHENRIS